MNEESRLSHSLAVQVCRPDGTIKTERYVKDGVEFLPNRLYMWLRTHGVIRQDTWKIPILFGTIKIRRNS